MSNSKHQQRNLKTMRFAISGGVLLALGTVIALLGISSLIEGLSARHENDSINFGPFAGVTLLLFAMIPLIGGAVLFRRRKVTSKHAIDSFSTTKTND